MNSYIKCFDIRYKLIGEYKAPFDIEVDCYNISIVGFDVKDMVLRGKCNRLCFIYVVNYNEVDLSGFVDLEINEMYVGDNEKGLLKILELNCEKIYCDDKNLEIIMNKYLSEPDPLMRDFEGFKLEMSVNGYGNRI